uniref:Uncharacterized protein n=1 Tax=Pyricularia oryzae (strain P131) TaxID=1143193 RepID=L7JRG9_PYRO1
MSELIFPGLAGRPRSGGAGASASTPAAGPPTTGLVRTPLPTSGKSRAPAPKTTKKAGPSAPAAAGPAAAAPKGVTKTRASATRRAPAPARRSRPPAGPVRPRSCLGCLRSALAGKQGSGDLAVCRETNPPSGRCYKCASGHSCEEIPAPVRPPAARFLAAVASGNSAAITRWRPVVKGMLEIWEEEKEGGGVSVVALSAEKKKEEAKRAVLRLVEVLF